MRKKFERKKKYTFRDIKFKKKNFNFCLLLNQKLTTINKQLFITVFGSLNYYKHLKVKIVKIAQFLTKL